MISPSAEKMHAICRIFRIRFITVPGPRPIRLRVSLTVIWLFKPRTLPANSEYM